MSRIAYVNGAYVPHSRAAVHIEDRGYQFGDGFYEVIAVRRGRLIDEGPHLGRLARSLRELQIKAPMGHRALRFILREVVRRNRTRDGLLYMQVTRGVARRDHAFPADVPPALVITCRRFDFTAVIARAAGGVKAISQPDIRWGRCDIKSTSLLPNAMAKQAARQAGAFEALLVDKDGYVTEGSSTNVWMVTPEGTLVTRAVTDNILSGITRATVKVIAEELQMRVEERPFSLEEAKEATELFLTSATSCAMPVVALDGGKIGDGTPGPVATRLMNAYRRYMDA
jgi:D-alanine transaminase